MIDGAHQHLHNKISMRHSKSVGRPQVHLMVQGSQGAAGVLCQQLANERSACDGPGCRLARESWSDD
jgi:hypothetical protein